MGSTAALALLIQLKGEASQDLAKLARASGQSEEAINKLSLAQFKAQDSALKLAAAESRLADNTDPSKHTQLEGAVLRARVALDQANGSLERAAQTAGQGRDALEHYKAAWSDLTNIIGAAKQGIQLAQQAYQEVVVPTVEYATEVRELARISGESAQATSTMIQVADDAKVSYGTLQQAAERLAKNGIAFNTEQLAIMADEYGRIPTSTGRAEYAIAKFGKAAGPDMARMLELGSDGLRKMAAEAQGTARILTEENLRAARELEAGMDDLNDSVEDLKLTVGTKAVPVMTIWSKGMESVLSGKKNVIQATMDEQRALWALVTGQKAATDETELAGLAAVDTAAAHVEYANAVRAVATDIEDYRIHQQDAIDTTGAVIEAQARLKAQLDDLRTSMAGAVGGEMESFRTKQEELRTKAGEYKARIEELEGKEYLTDAQSEELEKTKRLLDENVTALTNEAAASDKRMKTILFNLAEQKLAQDGVISNAERVALSNLATDWGLVDQATRYATGAIGEWAEKANAAADDSPEQIAALRGLTREAKELADGGFNRAREEAKRAKEEVDRFGETASQLDGQTVSMTVYTRFVTQAGGGPGETYQHGGGQAFARGGDMYPGRGPYLVGEEGPEWVVPRAAAHVYPHGVVPPQARGGDSRTVYLGGITINAQGASVAQTASASQAGIRQAMRAAGQM